MKFLTDQSRYPNCMRTTLTHSHSENLLGSQKQDATVLITVDITRKKKKKKKRIRYFKAEYSSKPTFSISKFC